MMVCGENGIARCWVLVLSEDGRDSAVEAVMMNECG